MPSMLFLLFTIILATFSETVSNWEIEIVYSGYERSPNTFEVELGQYNGANIRTGHAINAEFDLDNNGFNDLLIYYQSASETGVYAIMATHNITHDYSSLEMFISNHCGVKLDVPVVTDNFRKYYWIENVGDIDSNLKGDLAIASATELVIYLSTYAPQISPALVNSSLRTSFNSFQIEFDNSTYVLSALSGLGDINGDTIDDFGIGLIQKSNKNVLFYVIFGGNLDSLFLDTSISNTRGFFFQHDSGLSSISAFSDFGNPYLSISGNGDLNNDGFNDIVFGMPYAQDLSPGDEDGLSVVIFGNSTVQNLWWSNFTLVNAGFFFNYSRPGVAGLKLRCGSSGLILDVNKDNISDLIIGCGAEVTFQLPYGEPGGQIFVFLGSSALDQQVYTNNHQINSTNAYRTYQTKVRSFFGSYITSTHDLNGDEYQDFILSSTDAPWGNFGRNSYVSGITFAFFANETLPEFTVSNKIFETENLVYYSNVTFDKLKLESNFPRNPILFSRHDRDFQYGTSMSSGHFHGTSEFPFLVVSGINRIAMYQAKPYCPAGYYFTLSNFCSPCPISTNVQYNPEPNSLHSCNATPRPNCEPYHYIKYENFVGTCTLCPSDPQMFTLGYFNPESGNSLTCEFYSPDTAACPINHYYVANQTIQGFVYSSCKLCSILNSNSIPSLSTECTCQSNQVLNSTLNECILNSVASSDLSTGTTAVFSCFLFGLAFGPLFVRFGRRRGYNLKISKYSIFTPSFTFEYKSYSYVKESVAYFINSLNFVAGVAGVAGVAETVDVSDVSDIPGIPGIPGISGIPGIPGISDPSDPANLTNPPTLTNPTNPPTPPTPTNLTNSSNSADPVIPSDLPKVPAPDVSETQSTNPSFEVLFSIFLESLYLFFSNTNVFAVDYTSAFSVPKAVCYSSLSHLSRLEYLPIMMTKSEKRAIGFYLFASIQLIAIVFLFPIEWDPTLFFGRILGNIVLFFSKQQILYSLIPFTFFILELIFILCIFKFQKKFKFSNFLSLCMSSKLREDRYLRGFARFFPILVIPILVNSFRFFTCHNISSNSGEIISIVPSTLEYDADFNSIKGLECGSGLHIVLIIVGVFNLIMIFPTAMVANHTQRPSKFALGTQEHIFNFLFDLLFSAISLFLLPQFFSSTTQFILSLVFLLLVSVLRFILIYTSGDNSSLIIQLYASFSLIFVLIWYSIAFIANTPSPNFIFTAFYISSLLAYLLISILHWRGERLSSMLKILKTSKIISLEEKMLHRRSSLSIDMVRSSTDDGILTIPDDDVQPGISEPILAPEQILSTEEPSEPIPDSKENTSIEMAPLVSSNALLIIVLIFLIPFTTASEPFPGITTPQVVTNWNDQNGYSLKESLLINSSITLLQPGATWDLNKDGYDDLFISDNQAASNNVSFNGIFRVIFGGPNFNHSFDLDDPSNINQSILFTGPETNFAFWPSFGGLSSHPVDFNGDGFNDIIALCKNKIGAVYFGSNELFSKSSVDFSYLNGTTGFNLTSTTEQFYWAQQHLDINNDGCDEIFVSSLSNGAFFVIYGRPSGWPASIDPLVFLGNTSNGFIIEPSSGATFTTVDLFGINSPLVAWFKTDLFFVKPNTTFVETNSTLYVGTNSTGGITGTQITLAGDLVSPNFLTNAGDFNGDGFSDAAMIINLQYAFILFGNATWPSLLSYNINFSDPQSVEDFRGKGIFYKLDGINTNNYVHHSVGDINNDGFDDFAIYINTSQSFVLFGNSTFSNIVTTSDMIISGQSLGFMTNFQDSFESSSFILGSRFNSQSNQLVIFQHRGVEVKARVIDPLQPCRAGFSKLPNTFGCQQCPFATTSTMYNLYDSNSTSCSPSTVSCTLPSHHIVLNQSIWSCEPCPELPFRNFPIQSFNPGVEKKSLQCKLEFIASCPPGYFMFEIPSPNIEDPVFSCQLCPALTQNPYPSLNTTCECPNFQVLDNSTCADTYIENLCFSSCVANYKVVVNSSSTTTIFSISLFFILCVGATGVYLKVHTGRKRKTSNTPLLFSSYPSTSTHDEADLPFRPSLFSLSWKEIGQRILQHDWLSHDQSKLSYGLDSIFLLGFFIKYRGQDPQSLSSPGLTEQEYQHLLENNPPDQPPKIQGQLFSQYDTQKYLNHLYRSPFLSYGRVYFNLQDSIIFFDLLVEIFQLIAFIFLIIDVSWTVGVTETYTYFFSIFLFDFESDFRFLFVFSLFLIIVWFIWWNTFHFQMADWVNPPSKSIHYAWKLFCELDLYILPIIGTILMIPIIKTVSSVFRCLDYDGAYYVPASFTDVPDEPVPSNAIECYTTEHIYYQIFAAISLIFFIPSAVFSRPKWQYIGKSQIIFNDSHLVITSTCKILIAFVAAFFEPTPSYSSQGDLLLNFFTAGLVIFILLSSNAIMLPCLTFPKINSLRHYGYMLVFWMYICALVAFGVGDVQNPTSGVLLLIGLVSTILITWMKARKKSTIAKPHVE